MKRCGWAQGGEREMSYHDEEWGVPVTDDATLFEFITLEGAQAGLSWSTILRKREGYKRCFVDFDPVKVARFTEKRIEKLVEDKAIVRHRGKIEATVSNAKAVLAIQKEFGSFAKFVWAYVDFKPLQNEHEKLGDLPSKTDLSDRLSKDLRKRGFKFVGSTICYSFIQATGLVNDHTVDCFRHKPIKKLGKKLHL